MVFRSIPFPVGLPEVIQLAEKLTNRGYTFRIELINMFRVHWDTDFASFRVNTERRL